ncbi:7588_t:CDS:2 [Funneliformis geosporum]|uniref:18055_t:CDS:1 n=1 Tax=Funneliformis geosporum TaxID=1117311 RepID=A0A9W4SGR1_9GLOM|nr:7588_t:CDS:2 [Funneliformis geosporum]CAI2168312.1 18055_t:CDS:2 [Funneliformis geosporum]
MFAQCKSYLFSLSNNLFYTPLKARSFHTTKVLQKRHSKDIKRKNLMKKVSKLQQEKSQKPNVITGVPTKFTDSFLRPSQVYASTAAVRSSKSSSENNHQYRNYFLDQKDEDFLFNITPTIITENSTQGNQEKFKLKELEKVQMIKNLTSLHNANSKSILLYNIQLAIKEFARKEGDTGSAEVQGN